jgi:hypothetical protein
MKIVHFSSIEIESGPTQEFIPKKKKKKKTNFFWIFENLPGHFTFLVPGSIVAEVAANFKVFHLVKTGNPC